MMAALDFLTKHFFVLSTAITSLLTAGTFIFVVSYISVFDFCIIYIIEYTDILNFFRSIGYRIWHSNITIPGVENNYYVYTDYKK